MSKDALCEARRMLAIGHFEEAVRTLRSLEPEIARTLAGGVSAGDVALAHYHMVRLLLKGATHPEWFAPCEPHSNAHVLVFSHDCCQLLLAQRGHYKWLFPNVDTISVCSHGDPTPATAIKAIAKTLDIVPETFGLLPIGPESGHLSCLLSLDFCAFVPTETSRLRMVFRKFGKSFASVTGILLNFAWEKRTLTLMTLGCNPDLEQKMHEIVQTIQTESGVPAINAVRKVEINSLFVYVLSTDEEARVRQLMAEQATLKVAARQAMARGFDPESPRFSDVLSCMDADTLCFEAWPVVLQRFVARPRTFALDLCYPYFGSLAVVRQIGDILSRADRY